MTENDNGEFKIDSNAILAEDNTVSVVIEPDIRDESYEMSYSTDEEEETSRGNAIANMIKRQSIQEVWTQMTPHEISHWIDK